MTAERVLVFPREAVLTLGPFTPWVSAGLLLDGVGSGLRWVTRYEAENSSSLVQPILCAFVSDGRERYLLLRRGPDGREDLRGRLSLVVGGHVDYEEGSQRLLLLSPWSKPWQGSFRRKSDLLTKSSASRLEFSLILSP